MLTCAVNLSRKKSWRRSTSLKLETRKLCKASLKNWSKVNPLSLLLWTRFIFRKNFLSKSSLTKMIALKFWLTAGSITGGDVGAHNVSGNSGNLIAEKRRMRNAMPTSVMNFISGASLWEATATWSFFPRLPATGCMSVRLRSALLLKLRLQSKRRSFNLNFWNLWSRNLKKSIELSYVKKLFWKTSAIKLT